jgi:hypothetical protein
LRADINSKLILKPKTGRPDTTAPEGENETHVCLTEREKNTQKKDLKRQKSPSSGASRRSKSCKDECKESKLLVSSQRQTIENTSNSINSGAKKASFLIPNPVTQSSRQAPSNSYGDAYDEDEYRSMWADIS